MQTTENPLHKLAFNIKMCKLRFIAISLLFVMLAATTGCKHNTPEPEVKENAHRTILVYMAANNSLGYSNENSAGESVRADTLDIHEMQIAAKNGDLNGGRLLVYHADIYGTAKLYEITAKGMTELKSYANDGLSSIHAQRMKNVIADAKEAAPADDYGLILWSHGDGWLQDGLDESTSTTPASSKRKAFGLDNANNKKMNITTLASVLNGENFSFIYFDCCYMASVEVEYELRNVTQYIVASVSELPLDGMPYDENLKYLFATNANLVGAATNTYNYYNKFTDYWRTCTISVVRTAGLDNLAAATKYIYAKAEKCMPDGYYPQRFVVSGLTYYYDLGDYVKALATDEDYASWTSALDNCVLYKAATPYLWPTLSYQLAIRAHSGLSTYIFTSADDTIASKRNYSTLSWYNDVVAYLFNKNEQ